MDQVLIKEDYVKPLCSDCMEQEYHVVGRRMYLNGIHLTRYVTCPSLNTIELWTKHVK